MSISVAILKNSFVLTIKNLLPLLQELISYILEKGPLNYGYNFFSLMCLSNNSKSLATLSILFLVFIRELSYGQ